MTEGVLHSDLLPPLFLETVLTWAGSTSTSLIPRPAVLPHLWKESTGPQPKRSIMGWNFEQQRPRGTLTLGPFFPWKQGTQQV